MSDQKWQVLLPKTADDSGLDAISDIATFTSIEEFGVGPDDLRPHISSFDAVVLRHGQLTADVLEAADDLKVVAKHGVGLDNVDIPTATEQGIVVCNTPGANSQAVAEHALTLLFAINRQLVAMDEATRDGEWERTKWTTNELRGQTLGLFGCGDIAQRLVELSSNVGLEFVGYDPYIAEEDLPDEVIKVDKDTLFSEADAVSVHTPLTEETRHAISTGELAQLPSDGAVINTARGPVIDEDALVKALKNDELAGAGLDVFEAEPPSESSPLFDLDNTIVSPHIGGVTKEAMERMAQGAAENVRTVYDGELPGSTVNPKARD